MGLLLDTSAIVDLERSGTALRDVLPEEVHEVYLPALVVAELWIGVELAPSEQVRESRLRKVRSLVAGTCVLPFTEEIAPTYARLWAELARQGTPIPSNDLAIAATAVHYRHRVVVGRRDEAHFRRVPGLEVEVLGGTA